MTSHYTRISVTTLHDVGGTAFGHFLLGSHNLVVTSLASCVCVSEVGLRIWINYAQKNIPKHFALHSKTV